MQECKILLFAFAPEFGPEGWQVMSRHRPDPAPYSEKPDMVTVKAFAP